MATEGLTRLTVNLVPQAVAALDDVHAFTEDSRVDVVNRALQLYAAIVRLADRAPVRGTGFATATLDDLLGDGQPYELWIKQGRR